MNRIDIALRLSHPSNAVTAEFVAKLWRFFTEINQRWVIAKSLGNLSDGELRDIGLISSDVDSACAGPLDHEAANVLRRTARTRSGNW